MLFNKAIMAMILAIIFLNLLYNITIIFNLKNNEQSYDLYKYYFEATFPLIIFLGNVLIMTVFFIFIFKETRSILYVINDFKYHKKQYIFKQIFHCNYLYFAVFA